MLEQAAQKGGAVTISGNVQETFRCYTERHDLAANIGDRWMVELGDLGVLFSSLGSSMIL